MAINKISGNILQNNLQRGANLAIQGNLIYFDVVNSRIGVLTSSPQNEFEVNGVVRVGNITLDNTGNASMGSEWINNLADPIQNQDAATKFYVDSEIGNVANIGNLTVANTTIFPSITPGNITLAPTGDSTVIIDTVSGLVLPVGNTAQRPSPASVGTIRYNNDAGQVEIYDGSTWEDIVANVTNQTLNGDGSTVAFTLNKDTTTAAALVIINGVVQLPTTAYSVSGNVLTFTQAPVVTDVIDVRFL